MKQNCQNKTNYFVKQKSVQEKKMKSCPLCEMIDISLV